MSVWLSGEKWRMARYLYGGSGSSRKGNTAGRLSGMVTEACGERASAMAL